VEFALVIPLFLTIFIAICEFSFLFTAYVSINFASHDGSQLAASLGNTGNADHAVLNRINQDVMVPADPNRIVSVDIYWVDTTTSNAAPVGGWSGSVDTWTYDGGSHLMTLPGGATVTLPYVQTRSGYPESERCNVNLGLGCDTANGHNTVDTIGVRITYKHSWITPFPSFVGGGPNGPTMQAINVMRLEPIQ
jgi:hypothetical protein